MELNSKAAKLGLEGDADLQFLLKGGELMKVKSSTWKKNRFFKLQEDCTTMWHESNKPFGKKQTFSIDDIDSVRKGRESEGLQKYTDAQEEDRCFSIIFKGRRKNLDLMATSAEDVQQWVSGLDKIITNTKKLNRHWIFDEMRKADKNKDNMMDLKELKHFLRQINIQVDDSYAAVLFKECDTSNSGTLEGPEIKEFYDLLTHRQEIDVIYGKYSSTDGQMGAEDLLDFLHNEQCEQVTLEDAVKLIEKYEPDDSAKQQSHMTKDGFLMYLQQEEGSIFNPAHKEVFQDMSQPLNHYFVSSSHNTYLTGDQLKSLSSTEAYIKALMKSCRCVELDCWDGPNGEPVIYHGYTLTSKVLFKDVIKAIREYAFKTSEYPVILSLENHCTLDQQKLMAQHMRTILGSALLTAPLEDQMPTTFPSPKELKGRFIIKGQRLNKLDTVFGSSPGVEVESISEEDEAAEVNDAKIDSNGQKKKIKLNKELSDLVIYCKSVHFSGFENAKAKQAFYEMSSFKETKAANLAETAANAFIHHNMSKLSRIYPAGSRTDSSNYNPVPMWNTGCQIVALNFQTPSKEMDLNQGRFRPNGMSGYILKPDFLRQAGSAFDPVTLTDGPWLKRKVLHVMVISAQQLPKLNKEKTKSIVDPLVRVEIYGVPVDNASKETHHIDNNGEGQTNTCIRPLVPIGHRFNPMWNKKFQFNLKVPDLAMVRFLVEDYDHTSHNDFIGQFSMPLTSLQNGYRHVPLLTKRGDVIPCAGLFVHIILLDP
uniref:Phosphoinositide phospholipase C n=1 Tax=Esox lucius TaxID=8010 RepID=A0A6Q2XH23_ESOLU